MSWKIDPAHSQVTFSIRHMMISNVHGRFENFTGTVDFNETDPTKSSVDVKIDAGSINTREPMRDNHLKSPDFLEAEKYPTLNFVSKWIEKVDDSHARIHGDLTIRDITHDVVLDTEYSGQSTLWGKTAAGFSASTRINRKNWNLNWNKVVESGGWLVGDDINVNIELELIKETEAVVKSQVS
jgi:polyisoprenoid-binding protein YceI